MARFEVTTSLLDDEVHVTVNGELDAWTGRRFTTELSRHRDEARRHMVVHAAGIDFLDSGGLRALLSADLDLRSRGGSLRLRDPSPHVLQVLEITDLVDHFDARGSLDDGHG